MTVMSNDESPEEEHSDIFYQVNALDILNFIMLLAFTTNCESANKIEKTNLVFNSN